MCNGYRERPTVNVRNGFLWNSATQTSEPREGSILVGNCHKSNFQDFSVIVLFGNDLGITMIKLRKKYKELNFLVKKKQSIKLSMTINTCTFLIQKKLQQEWIKGHLEYNLLHTHYFTFSYLLYRQTVVIINCKCFEI